MSRKSAFLGSAPAACLSALALVACASARDPAVVVARAPADVDECASYPFRADTLLSERAGFGARAVGGDPTRVYHVNTLASDGPGSLSEALTSPEPYWIVFDVNGTIALPDGVKIKSNRTIDGRGRDITIDGGLKIDKGTTNVIISDIKITFPEGYRIKKTDHDLIAVWGRGTDDPAAFTTRDLWFHHLELTRGNDGAIDLRGASGVTISWSYVHHHEKAFLMWIDADHKPTPGMQVTMHHNFLEWVSRRGPKIGFGELDYYNNYARNFVEYGVASYGGARMLSENNIYEARPGNHCFGPCPDPNTPDGYSKWTVSKAGVALRESGAEPEGFVKSRGDVTLNGATIAVNKPERVFERSDYYAATPDAAGDELRERLMKEAGPRRNYCRTR